MIIPRGADRDRACSKPRPFARCFQRVSINEGIMYMVTGMFWVGGAVAEDNLDYTSYSLILFGRALGVYWFLRRYSRRFV